MMKFEDFMKMYQLDNTVLLSIKGGGNGTVTDGGSFSYTDPETGTKITKKYSSDTMNDNGSGTYHHCENGNDPNCGGPVVEP